MPRGGGRGHKGGHKGQKRHFTNPEELERMKEKEEKERKWREKHGEVESSSSSDEEGEEKSAAKKSDNSGSSSSEESDEETKQGNKGTEGLIEVENPNRVVSKAKKVSQLEVVEDTKTELSRREREELERQRARVNYLKMHAAGKTEEARADLARLAIIKKQREEAAKKREEEKKARDALKAAKTDSINKALGKGKKT